MSIGEPQHAPPALVARILADKAGLWGKYPPANGSPDFRQAVAQWLTRRFKLPEGMVDAERMVLPVAGTREALYLIAQTVVNPVEGGEKPLVLLPNPFYQVYVGAAIMAGAEPVFVPGAAGPASQPDFSTLPEEILARTQLAYLCSPANPQGSVADLELLKRTVSLARKYGFVLAMDECYSEIWDKVEPAGALEACAALGGSVDNVLVFHSLSKRSSAPGLRSGFVAGDPKVMAAFGRVRSYGGAATPLPIVAVAAALWRDETHVEENRALYRTKMDMAERLLGGRPGFARPQGGFFLWLDVGDGENAAVELWRQAKIRVLPGKYLARDGVGDRYVRIALVHDLEQTEQALTRIKEIL
ncbi:aminotransferase class I/II-fold pyridoxal phosphate-dependent enzyme [Magnetospirillum aberrantis SpK]|uniref:Aminotransferase class I/II-fold pyridoxal phosphate-dependent enzyme n=2 Tax=Magnetospirillum TaxID=13134 RepID=A0A7C9UYL3_9PROT|nr:aminotransferase class I/II-fold pyridoxal phosphate-dependent enzyme [Magnetospirillum aberrantis]NFV81652.1 aminotransferase class I/II-fold pyridoxal phosphate-dependent enzyme [Magnetospirillum aberrantis SpK]